MHPISDLETARALWDHLPLGVLVLDQFGVVRIVNDRALTMTGWEAAEEVLGRSVFDFVVDEDVGFVSAGIARGDDFPGVVLGPFRVRYIARDGGIHWSECWAYGAPETLGFAGHLVTLSAESVSERLGTAMRGIAGGVDLDASLRDVAAALDAYPVVATATVLSLKNQRQVSASGTWPLDLQPSEGAADTPWELCARGGHGGDFPTTDLPDAWRQEAERHQLGSVWVRAVDVDNSRRGVVVMWRKMAVVPSPNQERHIRDTLDIAVLAYSQHDHRSRLSRAAHRDHLTGAHNRARLDQVTASGIEPSGVLYVDLDGFKAVNDRHGHHTGDQVLRTVTERIERVIGPRDQLYRVGGDEFVVLCGIAPHRLDPDALTALAGNVVDAIGQPLVVDGRTIDIGASVGVSYDAGHVTVRTMLEHADREMLTAKRAGKRQWNVDRATLVGVPNRALT